MRTNLVLLAAVLALAAAPGACADLVQNGGFETGLTDWTPYYWGGNVAVIDSDQHSGLCCLSISATTGQEAGVYQTLATEAGQTVKVSLWVKKGPGTGMMSIGYNLSGSTEPGTAVWAADFTNADWQLQQVELTAAGTSTTIFLDGWSAAGCFDDVTTLESGVIACTVTDASTSAPIEGAVVQTADGLHSAVTVADGSCLIQDVPLGTYELQISHYLYQDLSIPNVDVTGIAVTQVDAQLTARTMGVLNGDFEAGVLEPWTNWAASHYAQHQTLDPNCQFGDQFIGALPLVQLVPGGGYGGSSGVEIGLDAGTQNSACGGVRQECYVAPGKYYRVRAMFKGNVAADMASEPGNTFEFALGLVDGRFDPGVYTDPNDPPPFVDDVVKMQCQPDWFGAGLVPEPDMPWHNIMATRSRAYNSAVSWDWTSTMDYLAPRAALQSATKQATGNIMTVVLYALASYDTSAVDPPYSRNTVIFDDVVLEEVQPLPAPPLGDLARVDTSAPYASYPDLFPEIDVDFSDPGSAKVVTGLFVDDVGTYCYIEEPDRSAGIRINFPDYIFWPAEGDLITFVGKLTTNSAGERVINADSNTALTVSSGTPLPNTVGMPIKSLSSKLPYTDPVGTGSGPSNVGLLARIWGRVAEVYNDGSAQWVRLENSGVSAWVRDVPGSPQVGDYVVATGCLGIDVSVSPGQPVIMLQIRSAADFQTILPPQ